MNLADDEILVCGWAAKLNPARVGREGDFLLLLADGPRGPRGEYRFRYYADGDEARFDERDEVSRYSLTAKPGTPVAAMRGALQDFIDGLVKGGGLAAPRVLEVNGRLPEFLAALDAAEDVHFLVSARGRS